jgi:hypothetical protein
MQDDNILHLVEDIDNVIIGLALKHEIALLPLSSVIVSRLLLANQEMDDGDLFLKLLGEIPSIIQKNKTKAQVH